MTRDEIIKRLVDRYLELKKKKIDPVEGEDGESCAGAAGDEEISDMLELLATIEEKVVAQALIGTGRCEHDNWKGECLRCLQEAKKAHDKKQHRPRK